MNITKLVNSKSFQIALFFLATMALAQPPPSMDNQALQKLIGQGLTQIYGVANMPYLAKNTKPGDALSGVEVARTSNTLSIDPTPCLTNQPKRVVTFVKPYRESKISDAKCSGKSYAQIQVIQQ
jgi:hypothetical protein